MLQFVVVYLLYTYLFILLQEHPRPKYETILLQKRQRKQKTKKKKKKKKNEVGNLLSLKCFGAYFPQSLFTYRSKIRMTSILVAGPNCQQYQWKGTPQLSPYFTACYENYFTNNMFINHTHTHTHYVICIPLMPWYYCTVFCG